MFFLPLFLITHIYLFVFITNGCLAECDRWATASLQLLPTGTAPQGRGGWGGRWLPPTASSNSLCVGNA